jgi:hypothetical protein
MALNHNIGGTMKRSFLFGLILLNSQIASAINVRCTELGGSEARTKLEISGQSVAFGHQSEFPKQQADFSASYLYGSNRSNSFQVTLQFSDYIFVIERTPGSEYAHSGYLYRSGETPRLYSCDEN